MDSYEYEKEHEKYIDSIVEKYENSVKDNVSVFFDTEDFEALINFYQSARDYTTALSVVNQALNQYPFSTSLMINKAMVLADVKRFAEAIRLLDKILLIDSNDIEIYIAKADILSFQGKYMSAVKILEDRIPFLSNKEDIVFVYLQMADCYEDGLKYDKVFECLTKSLEIDPNNEEALGRINYCVKITGEYEKSKKFHEEYTDKNPYSIFAWCNLSSAYAGLEQYDEAIDALKNALAIDDTIDFIHHDLVDLYLSNNQPEDALEAVNEYEELFGYDEFSFILYAECYRSMDNLRMAKYYYKRALNLNSNMSSIYYELGMIYEEEGELGISFAHLQKAIELDELNCDYLIDAAKIAQELDKNEKALEFLDNAFSIDKTRFEIYLIQAQSYLNLNDADNAIEALENGMALSANKDELQFAHIAITYFLGFEKEAIQQLCLLLAEIPEKASELLEILPELKNHPDIIHLLG
ncbi:MAG: tetratricopeptide repeat protein [Chitinophagales bacterium]|nr:tetratricopeptide repeat protein [Chitinophagales bacterium]